MILWFCVQRKMVIFLSALCIWVLRFFCVFHSLTFDFDRAGFHPHVLSLCNSANSVTIVCEIGSEIFDGSEVFLVAVVTNGTLLE
jgi:hypothetical protein